MVTSGIETKINCCGRKVMITRHGEDERLLSLPELSEMLGVPSTRFTGGGIAAKGRLVTGSAGMCVTGNPPSRLGSSFIAIDGTSQLRRTRLRSSSSRGLRSADGAAWAVAAALS